MQETFTRWPYQKPKIEVIETEYDAAVALTNGTNRVSEDEILSKKRNFMEEDSQDGGTFDNAESNNPWNIKQKSLWDD